MIHLKEIDLSRLVLLLTTLAFCCLLSPSSAPLKAGSLIPEHLSTVHEVRVLIAHGGLMYKPLPGFDGHEFERKAEAHVHSALSRCAITAVEASPLLFSVRIDKSTKGLPEGRILLEVEGKLSEFAALRREWSPKGPPSRAVQVTTWQASEKRVVRQQDALDDSQEMILAISMEFAQSVGSARVHAASFTSVPVPDSCFDDLD